MIRRSLLLLLLLPAALAGAVRWNAISRQPAEWYAGTEARAIAASLLQYQTKEGGWPKNTDMSAPPTAEFLADQHPDHRWATIDNGGTTTPLRYLAQVVTATQDADLRAAFERGFDYLLAAQYESGGWPQYFPLRPGYYTHITYNDNATVNVLTLLRETVQAKAPFAFVDEARRAKAAAAVQKAVACILRTQVKQDGKLTAWCAQHDETTFAPAPARNFEPVSLSGAESVGLAKFLMTVETPSPEIIAAVEGAAAWFGAVKIAGLRTENFTGADGKRDRRAVADPAAPPLWARFYELGTNRPIYIGRDKVIRYDLNEIEQERRAGYVYLGDWPADFLAKDYPRWRVKNKLP
jgi:PelA/Pel-15E family pectate lyase